MRGAPALTTIARELCGVRWAARGVLTFGSWSVNVRTTSIPVLDELARLFREIPSAVVAAPQRRRAPTLYLLPSGAAPAVERRVRNALPADAVVPHDGFVTGHAANTAVVCTEMIRVAILTTSPAQIFFMVDTAPSYQLSVHLSLAMHMVLFHFDRILLHAGAVRLGGRVHLFVGERGVGKTTVCLRLAAAGGTLLCDDHVVVRRTRRGFTVSGCSGRTRLTADTERFLLRRPLKVSAADFAGVSKKEIDAAQLCASRPFRDYTVGALYFPRVGKRFSVQPMSQHQAMAELLHSWRTAMRFGAADQLALCLDYFAGLTAQMETFSLELSSHLGDLDRLVSFTSAGGGR